MIAFRRSLIALLLLTVHVFAVGSFGQSAHVPVRDDYVTDTAKVLDRASWEQINRRLAQFERETSNEIFVAIMPALPEREEVASYSTRVFNTWEIGQKKKNNGALLCVYVNDRKIFIVTGYGLEGALPDATCRLIIENEIKPRFQANDFKGGIDAGITAMIAATKDEYKGTGSTGTGRARGSDKVNLWEYSWVLLIVVVVFLFMVFQRAVSPEYTTYSRYGRYSGGWWLSLITGAMADTFLLVLHLALSGGKGGSSGGSSGSSSGGGRSGGGGAGGSW